MYELLINPYKKCFEYGIFRILIPIPSSLGMRRVGIFPHKLSPADKMTKHHNSHYYVTLKNIQLNKNASFVILTFCLLTKFCMNIILIRLHHENIGKFICDSSPPMLCFTLLWGQITTSFMALVGRFLIYIWSQCSKMNLKSSTKYSILSYISPLICIAISFIFEGNITFYQMFTCLLLLWLHEIGSYILWIESISAI